MLSWEEYCTQQGAWPCMHHDIIVISVDVLKCTSKLQLAIDIKSQT